MGKLIKTIGAAIKLFIGWLVRLMVLPFYSAIVLIKLLVVWLMISYKFLMNGGELVTYDERNAGHTLSLMYYEFIKYMETQKAIDAPTPYEVSKKFYKNFEEMKHAQETIKKQPSNEKAR